MTDLLEITIPKWAQRRFDVACWEILNSPCCSSCHSEWDDGYGDPHEDYDLSRTTRFRRRCQGVATRVDLAKALLARRRASRG